MKTGMKSCRVTGPIRLKPPDGEATAHGPSKSQPPPLISLQLAAGVEPLEFFAFKECQELFRKRLTIPLPRVFAQLTGLRLHVLWHRPLDFQGLGAMPVLCPAARQRAGAKGRPPQCCESCLQRRWKSTVQSANQGRRFIGRCGATNFYACLQVGKGCPLTLVLQARLAPRSPSSHKASPGRNIRFRGKQAGGTRFCRRLPSRGGFGQTHPARFGIHRPGLDGREGIEKRLAEVERHSNRGRARAREVALPVARLPGIRSPTWFGKSRPEVG